MPISEETRKLIEEIKKKRKIEREQPRIAFFLYSLEMNSERLNDLINKILNKHFPKKRVIRTIHRKLSSGSTDWM